MSQTARTPSSFRPSLFHIALLIPWIALVVTAFDRLQDNSFLWHLRAGAMQMDDGRVLTEDPFSFTAEGWPWRTQSWLAELGYGWLEQFDEVAFAGVIVLVAGAVAFSGIGLAAYRYSQSVLATALIMLLSSVLLPQFLVPRPAVLSYPLFVLVVLAWDRTSHRPLVPLLFWIWAAVHGSFVIGLVYISLRLIQSREWKASRIAIVSGVATLLTAHGLGVFEVLWNFLMARPYLALISEWQTPDFLAVNMLPFVLAIGIVFYGATKGHLDLSYLWIFGPFLLLALSAERAVAASWIALVPLLGMSLRGMDARWARGFKPAVAASFVLVIVLLPFLFTNPVEIDAEEFPVATAGALTDVTTLHDDYAGGYLIYELGPEFEVYVDDRAELYRTLVKQSIDVRAARTDWNPIFDEYGIQQVLLKNGEPLKGSLEENGWSIAYQDDRYVVMRP